MSKVFVQKFWSKCSWETQLLLAAFLVTLVAHSALFLLIVTHGCTVG